MRGQLAIEWIVLSAVALLVLVLVAGNWYASQQTIVTQSNTGLIQSQLDALSEKAKTVFQQGAGATQTQSIDLPSEVNLEQSGINGSTLFIQLGSETIRSVASVPLQGSFPSNTGRLNVPVTSRASYVWVGVVLAQLSKYQLSFDLAPSQSINQTITLTNPNSFAVDVNVTLPPNLNSLTMNANPSFFTLDANQTKDVILSYTASALAFDRVETNATFSLQYEETKENLVVPVTVQFINENSGGLLRFVPAYWNLSSNTEETSEQTIRLCNDAGVDLENITLTPSTVYSVALPKLTGTIWTIAQDDNRFYLGTQSGEVYSYLSDFTYLSHTSVTTSPIRAIFEKNNRLYTASTDSNVYVLSTTDWNTLMVLNQGDSPVKAVYADEQFAYAGHDDGIVNVFSISNGSWVTRLQNSSESINAVIADDDYIYFASKDENVYVYRKSGLLFEQRIPFSSNVLSLSLTQNGFLAGTQNGEVIQFEKSNFTIVRQSAPLEGAIRSISSPLDVSFVVAATGDSGVYFLNESFLPVLHTSVGTTMQSALAKENGDVIVGSIDLGAYAIRYDGFEELVAGSWLSIPDWNGKKINAKECESIQVSLTVPPQTINQSFIGSITAENEETSAKWYVQVNVQ